MAKLTHDFFNGDTVAIAQALLGKYLVRNWNGELLAGRIKGIRFTVQAVQIKLIPHNTISVLVKDRSFPKFVMLENQIFQRSTIVGALTCDVL